MRVSEAPPTLTFQLDWASTAEREEILERMRELGRQTMNLRLMKTSRLLRMRAPEDGDRIVGWAGLDAWHTPGLAEFFSLYVVPEYRSYLVGLILETARCAFVTKECPQVERVLVRMESSSNTSLLRYRVGAGLMTEADPGELAAATRALCHRCELFGGSCAEQAFLWVDVARFLERGNARLGYAVDAADLPRVFRLDPSRIRKSVRPEAPAGRASRSSIRPSSSGLVQLSVR